MTTQLSNTTTIAAIATATGKGGVGIVRVSGSLAKAIGEKIAGLPLNPREAHYRPFKNPHGDVMDYGIALYFSAPNSYTGEDVLELQAHGGPVVLGLILNAVITHGAQRAEPGEFTERAFLNEKMDLAQAEAVIDLINASTETAATAAMRSLNGGFSNTIDDLLQRLIDVRMYIEAALDFPEEEIDFLSDIQLNTRMQSVLASLKEVFHQSKQGQLIQDGMNVVILGQPNAGKSSLMNALCEEDKAIVTDIAGTTRDVLESQIQIDGLPLNIIDTAGLRDTQDVVEAEGVKRAWKAIEQADAVMVLVDVNTLDVEQKRLADQDLAIFKALPKHIPCVLCLNKADLQNTSHEVTNTLSLPDMDTLHGPISLSMKTKQGLESLKAVLKTIIGYESTGEGVYLARQRHLDALSQTLEHTQLASEQLNHGMGELAAEELRFAQEHLSKITGTFTNDDLLGEIFGRFCIGK